MYCIRKPPSQAKATQGQLARLSLYTVCVPLYVFSTPYIFTSDVSNYYNKSYVLYPEAPKPSKQRNASQRK